MLPKAYINNLDSMRNQAYGLERRLNLTKIILEKGTPFPKGVELRDIDSEFNKWVDENLSISFDGNKLPTFKLYSNQKINEYAQSWQHLDDTGNLLLNFKTVTRENNPKHGENQGQSYNIPGDRYYPMFMVPVLQENGLEAYDVYYMKQPFCVNLNYSVSVITNKYELINNMNQLIHDKFKALDCYICPNGHYMPMTLTDISDESEYTIDDRKYLSQTYMITVKAYIIQEKDFKVEKVQSRVRIRHFSPLDKKRKKKEEPIIQVEEDYIAPEECKIVEESPYFNKQLTLIIDYPQICNNCASFTFDTNMVIESIETDNIYDFVLKLNGESMNLENEIMIYDEDNVAIEIERNHLLKDSRIKIKGYDPNIILDNRYNPESSLDDIPTEEEITFKNL